MAGRYATALYDLAVEAGAPDVVERDLAQIADLLRESPDLLRLVRSPLFDRAAQSRAFGAVLERLGANELTKKFIGLLAERRRLFALADIIATFRAMMARRRGETTAQVRSAMPLDEAARDALAAELKSMLKRDVKLELKVDPGLLGGLVVKVGSRMIDSSLATKLETLKLAMKEA